jgi:hypothetical protein
MQTHSLGSNLTYLKQLAGAGLKGIETTRRDRPGVPGWAPVAIGVVIGLLSAAITGRRKTASRAAIGGLVGSVVGFSAGLAWTSGRSLGPAARAAARRVNEVRDARWLATNPITYA